MDALTILDSFESKALLLGTLAELELVGKVLTSVLGRNIQVMAALDSMEFEGY